MNGLTKYLATMIALILMATAATAQPADSPEIKLSPEWQKALEPLLSMPVQDYGFIRSGYTYGENHLRAVYGKPVYDGQPGLFIVMNLMAFPHKAHTAPIIKVENPDLAKFFASKKIGTNNCITLKDFSSPEVNQDLRNLVRNDQDKWTRPINELAYKAQLMEDIGHSFAVVPKDKEWISPADVKAKASGELTAQEIAITNQWAVLQSALHDDKVEAGAAAAAALKKAVEAAVAAKDIETPNLGIDVFYHRHAPFHKAAWAYLLATVFYVGAWVINRPKLTWVGYGLMAVGFAEHTLGTVLRWILSGRAPLSNMFESFVFAIGGMILVALIFEAINRTRVVGAGSALLGFIFMVLAHKAPIFDSQIRPLMPALQSSWLTYHVVVIMLSYSAFALSFFIAILYLAKDMLKGPFGNNPLIQRLPSLETMDVFNYRIIAIGFPLLTLGIVFGAVWAATAWGRPWGFDPKETWSAITWLIYAVYLHARYLAGWKGRRSAILAIIGFAAVLFTYLGVNYLLPGLHSYV